MGVSKYIYTVYDAKTGDFVAKGTAAQLAGKGLFKDAGTVSTCYRSSRKTDKPRRWRMERAEAAAPMPEPVPTADNTQQRRVYWYRAWNSAGELLGEGTAMDLVALGGVRQREHGARELPPRREERTARRCENGPKDRCAAVPDRGPDALTEGRAGPVPLQPQSPEDGAPGAELRRLGGEGKTGGTLIFMKCNGYDGPENVHRIRYFS